VNRLEIGLLGVCVAVIGTGIAGVATHQSDGHHLTTTATTRAPATSASTSVPATTSTTTAAGPGASSQALAANMLTPTDLGGFYRTNTGFAASVIRSAPCLAGLGPSPSQSGMASTGLVGPDAGGLPFIAEIAGSYPGATSAAVYQQVTAALKACSTFSASIEGVSDHVPLSEGNLQQLGDASAQFEGSFNSGGRAERMQVGVALSGQDVVCVVWVAATAGYNPIYGDLPSTLSAAIGKLA
jgi:hypothetical protein